MAVQLVLASLMTSKKSMFGLNLQMMCAISNRRSCYLPSCVFTTLRIATAKSRSSGVFSNGLALLVMAISSSMGLSVLTSSYKTNHSIARGHFRYCILPCPGLLGISLACGDKQEPRLP